MHTTPKKPAVKLTEVKITSNIEIAPSVFLLSFMRDFSFNAGQVLGITNDPSEDARLYSIASGENDPQTSILYNIKPGGKLTPPLSHLIPGNSLWITAPFGSFAADNKPAYWIAAGTGIAPFLSMFLSGYGNDNILIHGGRAIESFYFSDKFIPALGSNYIRCSTVVSLNGIYHGRVTTYLENINDLPPDRKYYLCGSAEMVVDCREILLLKGIPFNNIVAEIYF